MSETEKLRSMLDERGIEWSDASNDNVLHTTWNNLKCWFNEFGDGWTAWGMSMGGTPDEAIAATLGPGTCKMKHVKKGPLYDVWRCSSCGYEYAESVGDESIVQNYCPNCGRKVVSA